jgi:catalase (peroxidase I)
MRQASRSAFRVYSARYSTFAFREGGARTAFSGALGLTVGVATYLVLSPSDAFAGGPDIKKIKEEIRQVLDDEKHDDGSFGPIFVRLAWHSSGTYDHATKTGGSNGAGMRYAPESEWGANAGLALARNRLEPIKKKHPEISYSDLWILAGVTAIEEMGGPEIPFHPGRKDFDEKTKGLADGLLPDATKGPQHLRDVFYRMGFNDQEIVALSGAHSLGRCHLDRSGFDGPWTRAPTTFSNEIFRLLLEEKWTKEKLKNGNVQYRNPQKDLMMLISDVALIEDPKFKEWVVKYAKDENLFKKDFAAAFQKLTELGTNLGVDQPKPWYKRIFGL